MKWSGLRMAAAGLAVLAAIALAAMAWGHRSVWWGPGEEGGRLTEILPAMVMLATLLIASVGAVLFEDRRRLGQLVVAGGALLIASGLAEVFLLAREAPPKQQREVVGPLVEVTRAEPRDVEVTIDGLGEVRAPVRAQLVPQVSGQVVSLHPNLTAGGFIKKGRTLLEIDPADYRLAVERARSDLAQAKADRASAAARIAEAQAQAGDAEIELERTQRLREQNVATEREVDKAEVAEEAASARLRAARAEREAAEARIAAAEVALEQARLDLDRTSLTLPFDAVVSSESVGLGQFLTAGQPVGSVYGTDAVEIPVPLEDRQLRWFASSPVKLGSGGNEKAESSPGPPVRVAADFAGDRYTWQGRVVRTEGEIDPASRTITVVVRVDAPRASEGGEAPPLIPGAFVHLAIRGRTLEGVIPLPRHALHDERVVWVAREGRVDVRTVEVARRDREHVYVSSGLRAGEAVIISPMDVVTDGMKVRVTKRKPEPRKVPASTDRSDGSARPLETAMPTREREEARERG